jgi:hypothetical protein
MVKIYKWIIVLVILCLIGSLSQACEDYEQEYKCDKKVEKDEIKVEEKEKEQEDRGASFSESKWFKILDKLIERFPIIERIIERILQWIFNNLLDMEY